MKKRFVIGGLLVAILTWFCMPAYALRCGTQLIEIGDTEQQVMHVCGKPTLQSKDKRKGVRRSHQQMWTYNFGPEDFLYVLTFQKGQLVDLHTDGYGY